MDNSLYAQLNLLRLIASEGSITAAARQLGITTPSASQALKQLENKIGVPLCIRSTRSIHLTEAGEQLLARTSDALLTLHQAVDEVRQAGDEPAGRVRITLSRFAYQLVLRPVFADFCRRYPQLQLEISVHDGTIDLISSGFDLGIRFGNALEDGVVARPLYPAMREGLYASRAYLDAHGTPQTPADLLHHRLVAYRFVTANHLYPLTLHEDGQDISVTMPSPLICNDIEVMNDAVRDGLAIARIFEPIRDRQADRDAFIPVLEPYWRRYPPVYLYYRRHAQKARRVQVLIDYLLGRTGMIGMDVRRHKGGRQTA